jgi:hypothetical protein
MALPLLLLSYIWHIIFAGNYLFSNQDQVFGKVVNLFGDSYDQNLDLGYQNQITTQTL